MVMIRPYKIAKAFIFVFLLYVFWYKYVFTDTPIILYGSVFAATVCIVYETLARNKNILSFIPNGVMTNAIMCLYSLIVGLFFASNQQVLVNEVKTYAAFSIVCFDICYVSKEEESMDWIMRFIILINVIIAINIIIRGNAYRGYGVVLSSTQNPNKLGLCMDLGIFCAVYRTRKTKKHVSVLYVIVALFIYIIIGCGSRKCLISALMICCIWQSSTIIQQWKKSNNNGRIAILCFVCLLIYGIRYYYKHIYINTYSYNRMEIIGNIEESNANQLRIQFYQQAFGFFLEKPLFGIGLGQFAVLNPTHSYAHSTYAEALADWGTVGCLIYFIPVLSLGKKLSQALISKVNIETTGLFLALWIMELFLGIGQIWFYEIEHLIALTFIFLYYDMFIYPELSSHMERKSKYVKV